MKLSSKYNVVVAFLRHSLFMGLAGLLMLPYSMSHASILELAREPFSKIINKSYQSPTIALSEIEEALRKTDSEADFLTLHLLASQLNLEFDQHESAAIHLRKLDGRVDPWLYPEHYVQFTFQQIRLDLKEQRELEALIALHHLLAYLRQNQSKKHLSETFYYLGYVLSTLGLVQDGERYLNLAESHFSQSGNRDLLVTIYRRAASLFAQKKDYEQSKAYLSKAENVITFSRISTDVGLLLQRACLGLHLGQPEVVDEAISKLQSRYEATDDPLVKRLIDNGLAKVFFQRENYDQAATYQQRYLDSFDSQGTPYFSGLEFLGVIRSRQGLKEMSRDLIEQANEFFTGEAQTRLRHFHIASRARLTYSGLLLEAQEISKLKELLEKQIQWLEMNLAKEKADAAMNIQALFKQLEQRHEIALLNKSNIEQQLMQSKDAMEYQIFIVLVFALVLMLAFVLLWRSTIIKRDQKITRLVGELDEMSVRDSLTMLHNRRYFKNTADTLIANCQRRFEKARNNESFLGFIMLDIDHLARLNQYYSHELGDYVLKQVAEDLREDCREGDILIRWGGEEFLILVNDTNFERLQKFCRRILNERNQKELKFQETKHQVTCSMGYVIFPFDGELNTQFTWEEIIKVAEHCLRIAKSEGRNRAYGLEALAMSAEAKYLLFTDFDACIDQQYVKLHKMEGSVAL